MHTQRAIAEWVPHKVEFQQVRRDHSDASHPISDHTFITILIRSDHDESGGMIPRGFIQLDRRERSRCLKSRSGVNNPAPRLNHGSSCFMTIESKGFGDCCVLVNPREGRKYTTNPEYEFYAKHHAQIIDDSCDARADAIESRIAALGAHSKECDCILVAMDPT